MPETPRSRLLDLVKDILLEGEQLTFFHDSNGPGNWICNYCHVEAPFERDQPDSKTTGFIPDWPNPFPHAKHCFWGIACDIAKDLLPFTYRVLVRNADGNREEN